MICQKHNVEMKKELLGGNLVHHFCPKCRRNKIARMKNQMLREMCGTTARAAREDMGL